jgi:histidyl-tRNA synthetase
MFGMKDTSGIGISFGLDRIYIVLDELDLFPKELRTAIDIIVVNFDTKILTSLMPYVNALRDNGKRVLVYPHEARLKKQLSLANQLKIPQAIIVGETEWNEKSCIIKNLDTGEQRTMLLDDLAKSL